MSEQLGFEQPLRPHAGVTDPSLTLAAPGFSLTSSTEAERQLLTTRMDYDALHAQYGSRVAMSNMVLEPGATLESQYNANVSYLNREGVSLSQFADALEDFGSLFDGQDNGYKQSFPRSDGGVDHIAKRATISGAEVNPLTGEPTRHSVRYYGHR